MREEDEDEDDFVDQDDDASSDDPPLKRPRLSLPIDDADDDDDDDLRSPPRLSGVEEFDYTTIELPRRFASDQRASLLPRGSIGSAIMSPYVDNDEMTEQSEFFSGGLADIIARGGVNDETIERYVRLERGSVLLTL